MEIEELAEARRQLTKLLGPKFVKEADMDEAAVNKVVRIYMCDLVGGSEHQSEDP